MVGYIRKVKSLQTISKQDHLCLPIYAIKGGLFYSSSFLERCVYRRELQKGLMVIADVLQSYSDLCRRIEIILNIKMSVKMFKYLKNFFRFYYN